MEIRPVPGMGDLQRAPMPHPHQMIGGGVNPLEQVYHDAMWSWERAAIRAQNLKRAKEAAQVMQTRDFIGRLPPPGGGPLGGLSPGMLTQSPGPRSVMVGGQLPPGMRFPTPKLPLPYG